jgi:phosphatidate cytidylyltransferase
MAAAIMVEPAQASRRGSETLRRTVTALAFAVPAAGAIIAGPPFLVLFAAALAAVMAWEWLRTTGGPRGVTVTWVAMSAPLVAATIVAAYVRYDWSLALVAVAGVATFAAARIERHGHPVAAAWGAFYVGLPALALLWLYARPAIGLVLVVWLIVVVIAADVAAYFVGRTMRGPKLAPRISPGKTWSGALGGVGGAVLVGLAAGAALDLARLGVLAAAATAFAIISQAGDLFESGIKRHFKVKDAGEILPGHGGMMDRVDGIVAVLTAAALAIWLAGGDARPWL